MLPNIRSAANIKRLNKRMQKILLYMYRGKQKWDLWMKNYGMY